MSDKEKILKTLSSLLETGILTANDVAIHADADQRVGINCEPSSRLHIKDSTALDSTSAGLTIENDGGGDPVVQYIAGTTRYVMGIDNNDQDNFKLDTKSNKKVYTIHNSIYGK